MAAKEPWEIPLKGLSTWEEQQVILKAIDEGKYVPDDVLESLGGYLSDSRFSKAMRNKETYWREQASLGRPVPPEVLKDYPDLTRLPGVEGVLKPSEKAALAKPPEVARAVPEAPGLTADEVKQLEAFKRNLASPESERYLATLKNRVEHLPEKPGIKGRSEAIKDAEDVLADAENNLREGLSVGKSADEIAEYRNAVASAKADLRDASKPLETQMAEYEKKVGTTKKEYEDYLAHQDELRDRIAKLESKAVPEVPEIKSAARKSWELRQMELAIALKAKERKF